MLPLFGTTEYTGQESEVGQKAKGTAKGQILQLLQAEAGSLHGSCQESGPAKCRAPPPLGFSTCTAKFQVDWWVREPFKATLWSLAGATCYSCC